MVFKNLKRLNKLAKSEFVGQLPKEIFSNKYPVKKITNYINSKVIGYLIKNTK